MGPAGGFARPPPALRLQSTGACGSLLAGEAWHHAAGAINAALGLAATPGGKPLLWKAAGYPRMPATLALCAEQRRIEAVCAVSKCAACFCDKAGWVQHT